MANRTDRPRKADLTDTLFDRDSRDDLANELGQSFLESATSGEEAFEAIRDQYVAEEDGGPFVGSTAAEEIAEDDDPSNPRDATREPFPTTGSGAGGGVDDEADERDD